MSTDGHVDIVLEKNFSCIMIYLKKTCEIRMMVINFFYLFFFPQICVLYVLSEN